MAVAATPDLQLRAAYDALRSSLARISRNRADHALTAACRAEADEIRQRAARLLADLSAGVEERERERMKPAEMRGAR